MPSFILSVIKGTILGKSRFQSGVGFTGQYEYHIQVHRVFKGREHEGMAGDVKVVTPAAEALCGTPQLTETKTYVITGVFQPQHHAQDEEKITKKPVRLLEFNNGNLFFAICFFFQFFCVQS